MSEFPGPATKPKHAGGRPRGSRDKVRRKPRGLASPPESNGGGELSFYAPEPVYEVERERGWHTLAAHLYATGATGTQLAREFGKDTDTIYNLLRQPWFIERVNQIVAERGGDAMELLRGAHTTAIQTVIAILNDPMVPARVRLMAADSIIDRVAGKATQRIEAVGVAPSSDPVAEVAQIEAEMEQQGGFGERSYCLTQVVTILKKEGRLTMVTSQSLIRASPIAMKMPMIEVTQNQNVAADHRSDPAVFTPSALSAVVHDKTQPDEIRRKAARLLIPHLQVRTRTAAGRASLGPAGPSDPRPHPRAAIQGPMIGWT